MQEKVCRLIKITLEVTYVVFEWLGFATVLFKAQGNALNRCIKQLRGIVCIA